MRALHAALLGGLLAVPAFAQRAVAPLRAPTLPGAGLPAAVLPSAPLTLSPAVAALLLPAPAARPVLPAAVAKPAVQAAAVQAVAQAAPAAAGAFVEAAAESRREGGRTPDFGPLFDGGARPAASVVDAGLPALNGVTGLEPAGFRGDLQGDQGAVAEPGSIFGWRPWDKAPTHGLPFVDRWVARAFDSKSRDKDPGFVFRGAPSRAEAKVFLYGETHSDKGLIDKNMRALAADLDPKGGSSSSRATWGRTCTAPRRSCSWSGAASTPTSSPSAAPITRACGCAVGTRTTPTTPRRRSSCATTWSSWRSTTCSTTGRARSTTRAWPRRPRARPWLGCACARPPSA